MKIRVLGAGMYGAHLATSLLADGHDVVVHELADSVFAGASGAIPARLHMGQHYSRSQLTRAACQLHYAEFMTHYGDFTHGVPVNIYAIAEHDSLVDFGTYRQILKSEIEFITVERPGELGLKGVEGALLTGERHILVDKLRDHFAAKLEGRIEFGRPPGEVDDPAWDYTIDCSFCANEAVDIDRYEACLTVLLQGPTDRAVTICDGPFPSVYPWDEERGLCSLTSAKWTPLARHKTWQAARDYLDRELTSEVLERHTNEMFSQMAGYYPSILDDFDVVDHRLAIRAMPKSAADARLIHVLQVGQRALRIRAGKLDAIFDAHRQVKAIIGSKAIAA